MRPRDFSAVRRFPGTATPGMRMAHRLALAFERIPAPLFALGLALLAWAGARGDQLPAAAVLAFMTGDWLAIALLPRFRRSFGPVQIQTLQLAAPRAVLALLPWPWWLAAQAAGTIAMIHGFWIEPMRVTVTRERLRSPRLTDGAPLRLLHLSDLHVERLTARERRVVALAAELAPDVVVYTGDFLSTSYLHDREAWDACRWVLARLPAPLGVLAVTGSPVVDRDDNVPALLDGLNVRWLRDESVTLRHGGRDLEVIGLSCTHRPSVDGPRLAEIVASIGRRGPDRPFTLLLHHSPDLAPEAAAHGIDLMLAGHTHGGQVRLPLFGAVVTSSLYYKAFEMGRRRVRGMTLHVTRGLGLEGTVAPRVRWSCPPEVVLWELDGGAQGAPDPSPPERRPAT